MPGVQAPALALLASATLCRWCLAAADAPAAHRFLPPRAGFQPATVLTAVLSGLSCPTVALPR
eukprot:3244837-Alexandrium_andersonii.AAC.1